MMSKMGAQLLLLLLLAAGSSRAQTPTGTIAGVVTDSAGAPIAGARVRLTNRDSGLTRGLNTSAEGDYSAAALPPGVYHVTAEADGFSLLRRAATVETGATTTVNLTLQVGEVREQVTVGDAAPLMNYESNIVGGVVSRAQIDNLPLNGRNFLELAGLEPGVTKPSRLSDGRVFVSPLGSGLQTIPRVGFTQVTVDGANISMPGNAGVIFQVSQGVVQEFQISTVNLDPSTSLTSNGAINIVTRAGGNVYHGDGFFFYRDQHLAAFPGLRRDAGNPHPFFQRQQFGFRVGGPVRRDRAFFFASYERQDQRGVASIQPRTPEFAHLGGIFPSPYVGDQFSARADVRLNPGHDAFVRYTHDDNRTFANAFTANTMPSGWVSQKNRAGQGLAALTSVLSPRLVNDIRLSYFFVNASGGHATAEDCPGCFGLGAARVTVADVGLTLGGAGAAAFGGRRYQLTDSLVWQKEKHRLRFGFDWEHVANTFSDDRAATQITLWSPARVRQLDPTLQLPSSFATLEDILQLPLQRVTLLIGSGATPWRNFRPRRVFDQFRLYVGDTWRVGPRLTVNASLAWSYEPNALNHDLTKPALLTPLLGADRLNPPGAQAGNFSPTLGFAWATRDGKTVLRGGAGRYFDPVSSTNFNNLRSERLQLAPLGVGPVSVPGSSILVPGGRLEFLLLPTTYTGAQLLSDLPGLRADLLRSRNSDNRDFSVRNLDFTKTGANLYDPSYRTPYAVHFNLGVQRELRGGLVLSADLVWKRFIHNYINGIDYNRWNSAAGPVIPACTGEQKNDVLAVCSNGNIYFDTTIGRARYKGLLVRAEKRFSARAQFLASYALGSYVGTNGTGTGTSENPGGRVFGFNNDDWFENYGPLPTDLRHVLNLSGLVELPAQFQLSFIVSTYSRPPFSPYVGGVDFNGDGTRDDLLPGTSVNQFNRGLDRNDLARSVERYNREVAGRLTSGGQTAPSLTLPAEYAFGDNFFTQDMRLSRTFLLGGERVRLVLFGEVFNLLNTANLAGYGSNLANPAEFGQPAARFTQVFGSGGPRAVQLGARISF
jgi:hypothetical protein